MSLTTITKDTLVRALLTIIFSCMTAWAGWITNLAHTDALRVSSYESRIDSLERQTSEINRKIDLLLEHAIVDRSAFEEHVNATR